VIARKKLGEILVEGGLLTQKQLEQALPFQKKSNLKLGQFLVARRALSARSQNRGSGVQPAEARKVPPGQAPH